MLKLELYFEKDKIRVIADNLCISSCASRETALKLISEEVTRQHIAAIEYERDNVKKGVELLSREIVDRETRISELDTKLIQLTAMIEELKKIVS